MSAMFSCVPYNNRSVTKTCVFQGVSPCHDQINERICNAHAELFGLTYRVVSYHNGDNEAWTKVVAYISDTSSLNIPLFIDYNNKILVQEIRAFAINKQNIFPNINVELFQERIACLMGLNAFGTTLDCHTSWLDDPTASIILRRNGELSFFNEVPPLHKILFACVEASNIRNVDAGTYVYLIANVSLTYNEATSTYAFVMLNKNSILKWTNKPNCVATPVVLDATRASNYRVQDRVFTPINNPFNCV